jgi:hypothetical protein
MTTPFVSGRSVHSLMQDKSLSPDARKKISRAYTERLRNLEDLLVRERLTLGAPDSRYPEDTHYFRDRQIDGLFMLEANLRDSNYRGKILIKSDNVIVDPYDLQKLTIIDAL